MVTDPKVFSRALSYARSLGALVMAHPQEPGLSAGAAVTSGKFTIPTAEAEAMYEPRIWARVPARTVTILGPWDAYLN